jgi:hypothetical protein
MARDLGIDAAGNRAGDALGRVPGVGRWLGGVVVALVSLVAGVVASVAGLATRHVPAALGGAVIIVLGKLIGLVQAVLGLQRQRALSAAEVELLTRVYRGSVELAAVRLVPGRAGVFSLNRRPFTLGATIYLKAATVSDHLLVHECAHVWQFQHLGPRYAAEAVWAQLTLKGEAYRWTREPDRGHTHWREFNREAQAQFLEDIAELEPDFFADDPVAGTARFGEHTELAREAVALIRAGRPGR